MDIRTKERCSIAYRLLILCLMCMGTATALHGQALPTATRKASLSAFGAISGVYTDLNDGRNLSITAGGDLNLGRISFLYPSLEVRGTFPVDKGNVASLKNILGGVKLAAHYGRIQPYGDFLYGEGQITYKFGMLSPDHKFFYTSSNSAVMSPGAGIDYRLTNKIGIKLDGQFQKYDCPVANSGKLWAKSISIGATYHF